MTIAAPATQRGFTLLEVLAAAMIFTMVVTVLIGTSGAAVQMTRVTASRLEASLIAETELARLDAILNDRGPLPEAYEETRDIYAIRVFSEPAIDDFGGGASLGIGAPPADGGVGAPSGIGALLALEAPGVEQFLLRYEIRVEWIDGAVPDSVSRTTYAFDWEGARTALPDLFGLAEDTGLSEEAAEAAGGSDRIPELPSLGDPR